MKTPNNTIGNAETVCPVLFQTYIPQPTPTKTLPTHTTPFLTNVSGGGLPPSDSSGRVSGNRHIGQIVSSIHFSQIVQKKYTFSWQSSHGIPIISSNSSEE
jgi:hypothetical protein